MKAARYILFFFAFIFSATAYSQVDRRIAPSQYKRVKKDKENVDFIDQTVAYFKKELTLDYFQEAAVKETLEKYRGELTILMQDQSMTTDERKEKAHNVNERIDAEVIKLLSPEQKEKYKVIQDKRKF